MFYIFSNTPIGNEMHRYSRDELDDIFGEYHATALENGHSVFMFGSIHVNAEAAANREAQKALYEG